MNGVDQLGESQIWNNSQVFYKKLAVMLRDISAQPSRL